MFRLNLVKLSIASLYLIYETVITNNIIQNRSWFAKRMKLKLKLKTSKQASRTL